MHVRSSRGRQVEISFDAVEAAFDTLKPIFNSPETLIDTVETPALDGNLRLHVSHLCHDVPERSFKSRDAGLEIRDIGEHLLLPAPQELELFHDQVCGFVGHDLNLVPFSRKIHAHHSASAPEMISISSLVIIAWRVRL